MKVIIADTSCLILFQKIDRFDILQKTSLKAKQFGSIPSVNAVLNLIDQTNFRMSDSVRKAVLQAAGELK